MIPTPQIVVQPIAFLTDKFAAELALTAEQKEKIIPILEAEVTKLQSLKSDTSLSALDKVKKLREIGSDVDAQITPLLNPEQQKKFEAARDRLRRRLLQKAASQLKEKIETRVSSWL